MADQKKSIAEIIEEMRREIREDGDSDAELFAPYMAAGKKKKHAAKKKVKAKAKKAKAKARKKPAPKKKKKKR